MKYFLPALLLLSACNLAPSYQTPDTGEKPLEFKEEKGWKEAEPADAIKRGEWWKVFNDAKLNELEGEAADANQDLKAAVARFAEARAIARQARADYFPAVTANGGYTRQAVSKNTVNVAPKTLTNDYVAGLDLSYEIDVWGRVRNEVSAAESEASASEADLATVDLSEHAELASDYFSLRGDDAQQVVLDETVEAYQKALDLTVRRHDGGVVSEVDVDQAETQLENAKTLAADMHLKRQQLEHAIAVLTGKNPSEFALDAVPLDAKPPSIAPDAPSTLLERRPDVASAERLTEAANAEIGVARAAWFPTFSLTGLLGFESANTSNLLSAPSRFWALGPTVAAPIFEGGRIAGENEQAHAEYDEAVANYRQTVLTAYQEVEDNLVAIHQLDSESKTQTAATAAADRSLAQAKNRYVGGVTTYIDVVVAENQQLQSKLSSIDVLTRQMLGEVQLIKALGGGWNVKTEENKTDDKNANTDKSKAENQ